MWRIQYLLNKHRVTCCGRAIRPIVRASKLIDNDTLTFDWNSRTRKFTAKVQRTIGKALTTRSSDQDLYWCRNPDNGWSRTVLHDKRHWRVLTIHRTSDMSWVHFAKRWRNIWPEKLDSREHQNWARVGESQPATYKVNIEWKLELNLWAKTILTRGSEFLMDWTSWSQTWSTKSTTTTSRRPLRRGRKHLRWDQMYLFLQADQRLKQNHEDLPLLAHLQELYLFVNQELIPIRRTQWQKDWTLFFGTNNYLEKKMVRLNSGDYKTIFETNLSTLSIGLMKCGRARWQEAEATRKDFNIVLTCQDKKLFISELFKVIQDAVLLILHSRTMCQFLTISSSTFIILDVQSVYTPSQIQDW